MSFLTAAARAASRRAFTTTSRVANTSSTARTSGISNTIRSSIERAQADATDEAFKAGVLVSALGVTALGAGYLIVSPNNAGKTVNQRDLL